MKKLIYISFIFAFFLAITSCEKEVIMPEDSSYINVRGGGSDDNSGTINRGGDDIENEDNITDPDEDEDFDEDDDSNDDDGITDPDEDEDFDEEEGGK